MGAFSNPRLAQLRQTLSGYVERGEAPGIVSLVSRHGKTHIDTFGTLTVEGGAPVRKDTLFRIASLTKPVTAAAALLLIEDCKLRLDDPVDNLLPELSSRRVLKSLESEIDDTVPADRPITVRDLLTFRSGYGILMAMPGTYPIQRALDELDLGQGPPFPQIPPAPDEWIRRLGTLPLLHQPGAKWEYNTGSDILGVLIARAAGQPFEEFLQERLFGPLGMEDTGFHVPAEELDRLPIQYGTEWSTGARNLYDPAAGGQWSRPPAFPAGGAGLVSTIEDFFAFTRMLLHDEWNNVPRVLSRASVELMTTDHLTPAQKAISGLPPAFFRSTSWGMGVGMVTQREGCWNVGTYGWDGGLGTSWRNDPREGLIGLIFTQQAFTSPDPPPVIKDYWTCAYAALDD